MDRVYFSLPAKDEDVWRKNCGRGVHHHCSWLPLLQRLKLLTKWTHGPRLLLAGSGEGAADNADRSSSPAVQQQAPAVIKTTAYSWAGNSFQGQANLKLFIQACDSLWPILTKSVDSCRDYTQRVQDAHEALASPSLRRTPVFQANYGGPWVLRALLLALLRSRGVKALTGTDAVSTKSFNQAVPDQCDWVERLCSHADRAGVKSRLSFKDFLDYSGLSSEPPEYCSMHLCIWGTNQLPEDAVKHFSEEPKKARVKVLQYKMEHGMWPHPITFLEEAAAANKLAASCPAVQEPAAISSPSVQGPAKPAAANAGPRAQNCVKRNRSAAQQGAGKVSRRRCTKSGQ